MKFVNIQTDLICLCKNYLKVLQLKTIRLFQFKNYKAHTFVFKAPIIGITGSNGIGKTNLLDAIYYLGFTKSYFHSKEKLNLKEGTDAFRLDGSFLKDDKKLKVHSVFKNGKKEVGQNGKIYSRFSQHIGLFPMVFIAPDDNILVSGGSGVRRKFLDVLLSQIDANYLKHLIDYQKVKSQRDKHLKTANNHIPDGRLLDIFDEQLVRHGEPIFKRRFEFIKNFENKIQHYYHYLSGGNEAVSTVYQSDLGLQPFDEILRNNRSKDCVLQRTSQGIHRDDLIFQMNGQPLKEIGSQGQKKSFVFGLKLAQFEVLKEYKKSAPILLLDDIFEKLDTERIKRLIKLISGEGFGQVFITDTEKGRLKEAFGNETGHLQLIDLK